MNEPLIPPALVLGCNTPLGINVLSDWIEEQTGHAPDFADTGWSAGNWFDRGYDGYGHGDGESYGNCYDGCDGEGYGNGYDFGNGDGYGDSIEYGDHFGGGFGDGYGDRFGDGWNDGSGDGRGYENFRPRSAENSGFWQRIGQRLRQMIQ